MTEVDDALWQGVKKGDEARVLAALERGANVDAHDNHLWTPLMQASKSGQRQVMSLLLTHGADVNAQDKKGATALVHALRPDYTKVVTLLLENGADPAIVDKDKDDSVKQITQKQIGLVAGTLLTLLFFVRGQRQVTKDKDLQKIEMAIMFARLCEAFMTYRKYEAMKKLLRESGGGPRHDN